MTNQFTVALPSKDETGAFRWALRTFSAVDHVDAAYRFPTDSVVYDETGKPIHLVRRWQPKTLQKALDAGAVWEKP